MECSSTKVQSERETNVVEKCNVSEIRDANSISTGDQLKTRLERKDGLASQPCKHIMGEVATDQAYI